MTWRTHGRPTDMYEDRNEVFRSEEFRVGEKKLKVSDVKKTLKVTSCRLVKYVSKELDTETSNHVDYHYFVFYDIYAKAVLKIRRCGVIVEAWNFRPGYEYHLWFDKKDKLVGIYKKGYFLCFVKPGNKIYLVNIREGAKEFVNKKRDDPEDYAVPVKVIEDYDA